MPSPRSVVPQLLEMMVRFCTPLRWRAAIRFSGFPQRPKPPLITTAPFWTSRIASSAVGTTLFIALLSLHHHRDAFAAADAQRGDAAPLVQVLHRVEQRHHQPGAGR